MKMTHISATLMAALLSFSVNAGEVSDQSKTKHQVSSATHTQHQTVNINTSNAEELVLLKGVGESKAKAIIEYRESVGKFNAIDELMNVKGIGPKLVEQNKAILSL